MSLFQTWAVGAVIIIASSFLNEVVLYFHDYIYTRLGINRNTILLLLWTIPIFVSFYISYTVKKYNVLLGISYVPIVIISLSLFHFINGYIGGKIDFVGFAGLKALFPILLLASSIACGIGTFLGIILKKE